MLLQDIFKDEYKDIKELYGIELNEESIEAQYSSPPEHFETLGFLLKLDSSDNSIHTDLLDIIINYKQTNLPIVLEIPTNLVVDGTVRAKDLIQLASNLDLFLSFLPPKHLLVGESIDINDYVKVIDDITQIIIDKPNFDKQIIPVSNFMEYLMVEKILGEDSPVVKHFKPENKYVIDNFLSILSSENSDLFKVTIRNKLYDYYGGKENFDIVANTMFESIQEKSEEIYRNNILNNLEQNRIEANNPVNE